MSEPRPYVGTAVVAMNRGEILLLRRNPARSWPGTWCFPGGHLEHGERLAESAAREFEEETAVAIDPGRLAFDLLTECTDPARGIHLIGIVYRLDLSDDERATVANAEPGKHDAIGWFAAGELPAPLMDGTRRWLEG